MMSRDVYRKLTVPGSVVRHDPILDPRTPVSIVVH